VVPIDEEGATPWYKSTAFIVGTTVGAALVGGAVGLGVALGGSSGGASSANIRLRLNEPR
jgi:hypothetical protein